MSSINTTTKESNCSWNTRFIKSMNTDGALVNLNGIKKKIHSGRALFGLLSLVHLLLTPLVVGILKEDQSLRIPKLI
jgi:hypothetical protein